MRGGKRLEGQRGFLGFVGLQQECDGLPVPAKHKRTTEYAPVMELVDMQDFGAVTSVKEFPSIR